MANGQLPLVSEAQILFCSMSQAAAHLDCISESSETFGWPFALVASIPPGVEWSAAAAGLIGRWTRDNVPVEIQLEGDHTPFRVRISDGLNAVRLDVVDVHLQAPA